MEIARQRATASGLHSRLPGTGRCQTCHEEHQGREASISKLAFVNIDHKKLAGFNLEQHRVNYDGSQMHCISCHTQDKYIIELLDCISCHVENDHDYMATHLEKFGNDCLQCHDGSDRMMDFDHETVYSLADGHADLECNSCHIANNYRETATTCIGCHEEPDMHMGVFGQDCARCHTPLAWSPAQLTQHAFLIDHGGETLSTCETCHAGSYTEYPCYSCHTRSDLKIAHIDEQYENINDCIACHPSGRGWDATVSVPNLVAERPAGVSAGN